MKRRCGRSCWPAPHVAAALGPDAELEDRHTAWPIPAGIDRAALTAAGCCSSATRPWPPTR